MAERRTVLITGATGKQGGAVARALKGKDFKLRAMTRKPESDAAKALAADGIDVVQGDLNNPDAIKKAVSGAWGVFAVQNTWEAGVAGEEEQGKQIAKIARDSGVHHFVYTSVGSADRNTGIPHFENKHRVENTIRSLKFPSHVILRPVFFMENLPSPWFLNGDNLYAALAPATKLQMIAVDDIGKHGARAFIEAEKMNRQELDLAGDAVTMPEAAAALSKGLKRTITFAQIPISEVRKNSEDFAAMLEWFERVGYDVDIAALARESGIRAMTLGEWAARL